MVKQQKNLDDQLILLMTENRQEIQKFKDNLAEWETLRELKSELEIQMGEVLAETQDLKWESRALRQFIRSLKVVVP